ncbi:MAG: citryl-CoA lyase [Thermodesulfobacteriota bacterium]
MKEEIWKTAITKVEPNKLLLRGYRIDELIGNISFSQAVFLAINGELPSEKQAKMIDAMLVSSVDHGVTPPSCLSARTIASAGAPLNAALAGGILAISKHHGGAIEDCMKMIQGAVRRKRDTNETEGEIAAILIKEHKGRNKRLSGFGHRIHTRDPRTIKLFQIASDLGIAGEHVGMAKAIENAMEQESGKKLPINVDGAIAALLCEMNFPPELANAFFMLARLPGLIAHVYEEQTRMKPMRYINPKDHEYDGFSERKL